MRSTTLKGAFILIAVVGAIAVFFFTQQLISKVREQQRQKVDLWVKSLRLLVSTDNPTDVSFLFTEIVSVIDFPAILSDSAMNPLTWRNVKVDTTLSKEAQLAYLRQRIAALDKEYPPVEVWLDSNTVQYVHYGDSDLVKALQLAPILLGIGVGAFILIAYFTFSYIRRTEVSSIWVGMAKETAHQLGTPISSLMGWLELLKTSSDHPERQAQIIFEMQTDINRLNRVATRFSKIGSKATLLPENLASVIETIFDYYRARLPQMGKSVSMELSGETDLSVPINRELMEWVFENLVKNSLDAIERKSGTISAVISTEGNYVVVDVHDTGKGIEPHLRADIFRPGFSTKPRGWGLGLTLAKRIVEDYHGGKLLLKDTAVGKGTTFRIKLKRHL
ncbi:MAG: HAMP domain-containing sensor histidine kinase [Chloroherpetonaceae bacterium]|nr:HAMP domain-containing histidine kinase [Chloroherpetonaceae bacterium]MDW8018919.1 HAMP domain-containing sensor histidine kinase [Chloroherpetonaceae bacterium]